MKYLDSKPMVFMPPKVGKAAKKCTHKTFGRMLKAGKWHYLPCMCKVDQ